MRNKIQEAAELSEQASIQLQSQLHNPVPSIHVLRQVFEKILKLNALVNDVVQEINGTKPKVGL